MADVYYEYVEKTLNEILTNCRFKIMGMSPIIYDRETCNFFRTVELNIDKASAKFKLDISKQISSYEEFDFDFRKQILIFLEKNI